jgi:hypothetical protein
MKQFIIILLLISMSYPANAGVCEWVCGDDKVQAGEQCPIDKNCPDKLAVCEKTLVECDGKVKEIFKYSEEVETQYKKALEQRDKHIKAQDEYIKDIEDYAKHNDANSWWNRNKMLIGFIGGVLFTGAAVWGAGQLAK